MKETKPNSMKGIMSNQTEDYVFSTGQLVGLAALIVAGTAIRLGLGKIADRRHKRQIARLNEQFSLPSYEKP